MKEFQQFWTNFEVELEYYQLNEQLRQAMDCAVSAGSNFGSWAVSGTYLNGTVSVFPDRAISRWFVQGIPEPVRIGMDKIHAGSPHIDYVGSKVYFSQADLQGVGWNIGSIAMGDANPQLCSQAVVYAWQTVAGSVLNW